ncbi:MULTISPECIES: 3-isopropylmalate dehydrogenase [Flammeovirga]|uniref:3-isopropylmalate dehydrogenase n=1 Tax=Flammeovirga aprica JL-4 TaxID=694437 RepID=A0A7X9S005_9BACT|nr:MULTISPECIES: 3-isopropylmalate dehydrogenase [Flammeovirga]KXX68042.1 3-isopropylmalate dehydrogenase [Flammeovirga sp. SJP92]MBD0404774.1 3-isopropylmalate dehydrogenase [Flammeovirga sp. EKP202]NME71826.1 3-isopropylmalate dehydrogenase [Flammeovirga aprica JL-4]
MNKKITVLAGDGIGLEVTGITQNILEIIGERFGHSFEFSPALIGHSAIEATGEPCPQATIDACKASDAVLLGAVGMPMYDNNPNLKVRPEQGLLKIRKELGLFSNIRPIKLFDELLYTSSIKPEILQGSDIIFFRELTGGIYFGTPRERNEDGTEAIDTLRYSKMEVERIARQAFESAMTRRKKLCSVDKANVLESSRLWRETVQALSAEYPEVEVTHMFIDNAAMQLIRDPKQFDVIVTGNMFGDILTDEASQIAGSMGMLPSASVGSEIGLYEPIHGSAPDIAGKGIANPIASVLSGALLLDISFGLKDESDAIISAVDQFLKDGYRTLDIATEETPEDKRMNTEQTGKKLAELLASVTV